MKKLLNKKGFTLMEMLIVVAIIVILVAISIPAFSSSLESAKVATDAANFRSAKAAAMLAVTSGTTVANGAVYDLTTGKFVDGGDTTKNVGECTAHAEAYIVFDNTIEGVYVRWTKNGTDTVDPCN